MQTFPPFPLEELTKCGHHRSYACAACTTRPPFDPEWAVRSCLRCGMATLGVTFHSGPDFLEMRCKTCGAYNGEMDPKTPSEDE